MTILVALGIWMAVVAMMLKFFQYVHDCDKQIENLGMRKRTRFRVSSKGMRVSARHA
jgi:hypothetical protein